MSSFSRTRFRRSFIPIIETGRNFVSWSCVCVRMRSFLDRLDKGGSKRMRGRCVRVPVVQSGIAVFPVHQRPSLSLTWPGERGSDKEGEQRNERKERRKTVKRTRCTLRHPVSIPLTEFPFGWLRFLAGPRQLLPKKARSN